MFYFIFLTYLMILKSNLLFKINIITRKIYENKKKLLKIKE